MPHTKLNMIRKILLLCRFKFFLPTSLSLSSVHSCRQAPAVHSYLRCASVGTQDWLPPHALYVSLSLSLFTVTTSSANSPPATKISAEVRASWTSTRWMQIKMRVNTVIAAARLEPPLMNVFLSDPFLRVLSPLQFEAELLIWAERSTWITEFTKEKSCEPPIDWRVILPEGVQKKKTTLIWFLGIGWTWFEI